MAHVGKGADQVTRGTKKGRALTKPSQTQGSEVSLINRACDAATAIQVARATPLPPNLGASEQAVTMKSSIALYHEFAANDAIESVLSRGRLAYRI